MSAAFTASERFPAELTTPAAAWRFVTTALDAAGVEAGDAVPVVVSEVVTNAVLHAVSTTRVVVLVDDRTVRVEVHDSEPTLPTPADPTPDTVTGRGLLLVNALTDRWGATPTDDGKVVWFEVDR